MPEETTPAAPAVEFRRSEDFVSVYANNALFEASLWDLKVILGILDQTEGKVAIEQHTAVSMPWMQVKLFSYWLRLNIAIYETNNGKIHIPEVVRPPVPPEPESKDAQSMAVFEIAKKVHLEFMDSL
jgi:hypothetical protein